MKLSKLSLSFWPGVDLTNPQMESTKLPVSEQVDSLSQAHQDLDKSTFGELCSDSKISHVDDIKMLVSVIKQKDLLTLKASIRPILGKEASHGNLYQDYLRNSLQ